MAAANAAGQGADVPPGDRHQPRRTQQQGSPELAEGLHTLTDGEGRPISFLLTGGQGVDCRAADVLLDDLAPRAIILGDKAYDSNAIRDLIERQRAVPNIPSKVNRRWKSCFSRSLYKGRNAVERMFCRLKDFRRIATR